MYRIILVISLICVMGLGIAAVSAEEASIPTPTPTPDTPADNACYKGGTLWRENGDGCPTEWYWKAGWYLARVESGTLNAKDVPDEFQSAMPPQLLEDTPPTPIFTICKISDPPIGDSPIYKTCVSIDQTGYSENPTGAIVVYYRFYTNGNFNCPTTLNGFRRTGADYVPYWFGMLGFSTDELINQLKLPDSVCFYNPPL